MLITQATRDVCGFLKSILKVEKKMWHVFHMADAALGMDTLVLAVAIKEY